MSDLKFTNDQLLVAGLTLAAPWPGSPSVLFESVKNLTHDQMVAVAKVLGLPLHGNVETYFLSLMVGAELQSAWYREKTGNVPANVALNHEARRRKYEDHVESLIKGRIQMAEKVKKTKVAKKEKVESVKKSLTYSILKSKLVGTAIGKKAEDEKVSSHVPLVAQVLLGKPDKAWSLADVLDAVKATKRYTTKSGGAPTEVNVRGDLNLLEKEGLVKVTEAA